MQIIGIYLISGDQDVIKCLSPKWYPFGDFPDCHKEFEETHELCETAKVVNENKSFINKLYGLCLHSEKKDIPLSINCIVGKNGTGKSTLVNLYYRIINNFSYKFHMFYPDFQTSFEPIWSKGFEAELYYECDGKIGCIYSGEKKSKDIPVRLFYNNKYDLFEEGMQNKEVLEYIYRSFFYTIATDYSLYSSSELEEEWKPNLYHKNDGYYTPIVLLPYRDSNNIDINKENELAKERIEVLSLLLGVSDLSFINGYLPHSIKYKLKNPRNYRASLRRKIERMYLQSSHKMSAKTRFDNSDLFLDVLSALWKRKLENTKVLPIVLQNALLYLSYKTIKTCINYDVYSKYKIFNCLEKICDTKNGIREYLKGGVEKKISIEKELNKIEEIIETFLNTEDHTTKKIRHTYYFLTTKIYANVSQSEGIVDADAFIQYHIENNRISYNEIAEDLLPPIFDTVFYLKKIGSKKKIALNTLSSGELHFINSLSYIVYHLVNLQSVNTNTGNERIKYKNVSLIFDEAEVYYHPEYQREFICKLINLLNNCKFFEYFEMNITIITHSPFMVSDIPSSNIQRLLDVEKEIEIGKTFSANIYDLLKHQFYLNAPVGGVAEEIFNTFIHDYKHNCFKDYKANAVFYNQLVDQIGDDYFRKTMKTYLTYLIEKKDEED